MSTIPEIGQIENVKKCSRCDLLKPLSAFGLRTRKWKNKEKSREAKHLHSACRRCRNVHYSNHMIKKRYGIDRDQYWAILKAQNGACALCEKPCVTGKNLAIDHDHETGKVRGLLCMRCNRAVGLLRDSAEAALKLYSYLMKARG
jgi:Recombination endonuclease VII